MKKFLTLSATALATMIALAGCSTGTSGGSMPGMDHGKATTATTGSAPASVAGGEHNAADTMFAQGMIPHHDQAVQMSETMLAKTGLDPKITALATDIKAAQGPEIAKMTGWLTGWSEPTAMAGNHAMNGMMSTADMDKLTAAQGAEAGRLFLTQMVAHHEGAVGMAKSEAADGKNADAVALAKSIVASQEAEIKAMKDLLAAL